MYGSIKENTMSRRTSFIWKVPKDRLQNILDTSSTYKEVLLKLGIDKRSQGTYNRRLHKRIEEDKINLNIFSENSKKFKANAAKKLSKCNAYPDEQVFCKNAKVASESAKNRIMSRDLIPYRCKECGCGKEWNGKPISLHLDHINGINNDHTLDNLRFLCPNCHSQTETYGTKRFKKKCFKCKKEKVDGVAATMCKKCRKAEISSRKNSRKFDPSKKELIKTIKELNGNMVQIGKHYNVSDNAIRKRCKKMEIDWKDI